MNRVWRVMVLCGAGATLCAAALGAPPDKKPAPESDLTLLRRAVAAQKTLRYRGSRVVEVNRNGRSTRYVEYVEHDHGVTRIGFGKGSLLERQTVVETNGQRKVMDKVGGRIRSLATRQDDGLARLAGAYRGLAIKGLAVRTAPGGRVAGIPTTLVEVSRANGLRQQAFWIDTKRGLLLRREVFDARGLRAGFFEYTAVQYDPVFSTGALAGLPAGSAKSSAAGIDPADVARICQQSGLPALVLPPSSGYRLVRVRQLSPSGAKVIAQSYVGTGRDRLSLFMVSDKVDMERLKRLAGPNLQTRTWRKSGATLVLMGQTTAESLSRLSRQVVAQERAGGPARHNPQ